MSTDGTSLTRGNMDFIFQIEAISKSKARLTRLKIPVPQYVIGHSFDTVFKITNLTGTKSPRLSFKITAKMDEYSYDYIRHLQPIPAGASFETEPINWTVLNQGVCTFSFVDIIIAGDSILLKKTWHDFIDRNGKPVVPATIFHSVVTTTPEGVYEYWARAPNPSFFIMACFVSKAVESARMVLRAHDRKTLLMTCNCK